MKKIYTLLLLFAATVTAFAAQVAVNQQGGVMTAT